MGVLKEIKPLWGIFLFLAAIVVLLHHDGGMGGMRSYSHSVAPPDPSTSPMHVQNHTRSTEEPLFTPKFSASSEPNVLNVHIVPHTHDDVGWLKTVEQYFYGTNRTIQRAFVQSILTTTFQALLANPNRTFTYVEQKFFSMWWNQLDQDIKKKVRDLVHSSRQLSFVNGGWCMHDEATTHFMGMIDQTTLGHSFLKRELNYTPFVGWQLDPFGHSATQASTMSSKMGFDALYFGRIDYQDLDLRHETQECEGLWSSSPTNMPDEVVFWGLTGGYYGNYGPPKNFCFDVRCGKDETLVGLNETQLLDKLRVLFYAIRLQANRTKGNHIMLTMGSDFFYEQAQMDYSNMDLMIHKAFQYQETGAINVSKLFGGRYDSIEMFYSNPNYYTERKYSERDIAWQTKTDDFMPYADHFHAYWTGYFVSRAGFKRLERVGSSFLMAARQMEALSLTTANGSVPVVPLDCPCHGPLYELEDAMGVVQHHDAVTGTAKQHVADDYARRVQSGINQASSFLTSKLRSIFLGGMDKDYLSNMMYCQFLNETSCEVSEEASDRLDNIILIVYNGLARERETTVGIPLRVGSGYTIHRLGRDVMSDPVPSTAIRREDGKYMHYFQTQELPPTGAIAFLVAFNQSTEATGDDAANEAVANQLNSLTHDSSHTVTKGSMSIQVDTSTGTLQQISNTKTGVSLAINQTWGYYASYSMAINKENNTNPKQNSGAYIFRPQNPTQAMTLLRPKAGSAVVVETDVVAEVHLQYEDPWIEQIIRLYANEEFVEVDYKITSIPVDDGIGKEVVTRFATDIVNLGTFYTDSNGREFQQRIRSHRRTWNLTEDEPIAGNYYPVNAAIYIEDTNTSLGVLPDRSQGGSSIIDGSIEIMVHRRILEDDSRGVGEAMNETLGGVSPYPPYGNAERIGGGISIGGRHRIVVGNAFEGASIVRSEMDAAFSDPLVFAGSSPNDTVVPMKRGSFSLLGESLPSNVMLVTFSVLHDGGSQSRYLIRVAHQYGKGESDDLSQPVKFCMGDLFPGMSIASIREMTLSGNQAYDSWTKGKMDWQKNGTESKSSRRKGLEKCGDRCCEVALEPMDIRSFEVQVGDPVAVAYE